MLCIWVHAFCSSFSHIALPSLAFYSLTSPVLFPDSSHTDSKNPCLFLSVLTAESPAAAELPRALGAAAELPRERGAVAELPREREPP